MNVFKYLQLTFSNETTYQGDEIGQAINYNCITFLVISESKGIVDVRFDQHALDNAYHIQFIWFMSLFVKHGHTLSVHDNYLSNSLEEYQYNAN